MKKILNRVTLYARENTNNFIAYLLSMAFILFYLGFYFGRLLAK